MIPEIPGIFYQSETSKLTSHVSVLFAGSKVTKTINSSCPWKAGNVVEGKSHKSNQKTRQRLATVFKRATGLLKEVSVNLCLALQAIFYSEFHDPRVSTFLGMLAVSYNFKST